MLNPRQVNVLRKSTWLFRMALSLVGQMNSIQSAEGHLWVKGVTTFRWSPLRSEGPGGASGECILGWREAGVANPSACAGPGMCLDCAGPGVRWRGWEELRSNGKNAALPKVVRLKIKLSPWKQTKHVCRYNFADSGAIKEGEVREAVILGAKFNGGTNTQGEKYYYNEIITNKNKSQGQKYSR